MSGCMPLPEEFKSLEKFGEKWVSTTAFGRAHLRDLSDENSRREFYDAVAPLAESALNYLDRKSLAEHSEEEKNLMSLLLSYAHVSLAVELQKQDEEEHAKWRPYMRITRAMSDA